VFDNREIGALVLSLTLAVAASAAGQPDRAAPRTVATLGWGAGANQVGYQSAANDIAYEDLVATGPAAVAVGSDGRIWVADTCNDRLLAFDGSGCPRGLVTHPSLQAPGSLAVAPDGTLVVVLTRDGQVLALDDRGTIRRAWAAGTVQQVEHLAIDGRGRPIAGDLGADQLVLLSDGGRAAGRLAWEGTGVAVSADGQLLDLTFDPSAGYALRARARNGRTVRSTPVPGVREGARVLGCDARGTVYVRHAVDGLRGAVRVIALDSGALSWRAVGTAPLSPAAATLCVHPDGGLMWLECDAEEAPRGVVRLMRLR
jgi:outer membrane protein assembly factor BamB